MKPLLLLVFSVLLLAGWSGCASSSTASTTPQAGEPVSSMPWNKPQSWEGTGALGGAMGR